MLLKGVITVHLQHHVDHIDDTDTLNFAPFCFHPNFTPVVQPLTLLAMRRHAKTRRHISDRQLLFGHLIDRLDF